VAPPRVIAITGNIGAGKSLVGDLLKRRGFTVIDTDEVVHELFDTSEEMRQAIAVRFPAVLKSDGSIDRVKLGAMVFDDPVARKDLERIVHPAVLNACDRSLDRMPSNATVFMQVPLLFEAGLEQRYNEVWTVTASEPILRERLRRGRGMTDAQITKRLSVQIPQQEKARRSDRVINNSNGEEETARQLDTILTQLNITK
jgi:dephospho-CoA kinase